LFCITINQFNIYSAAAAAAIAQW